ncbi:MULTISPECIES: hypothetical protein [Rhodococcus]|uniref:hypothetical protein n=1 Tax=Rhodococcus TaxID=1827 RepID=UPI000AB70D83|nr:MULTISPECIES: hypothetical protein [Rhodococcus]MCJ0901409.1 hypothetical protein [Rhodococcus sp. ARC_M13]UKO83647.1 hypothetical protein ITJ47_00840 [Rhodococcus erythropolis]BBE49141.1 hypothetical protein RE2895_60720 [Rhodococcus erythropolis]
MSSPRATEPTLSQGLPGMRRRHESLEADFATPASATYALVPDDDDLTDPVVSSNVHLPTAIAAQLAEARTERRLTTGEFIIWAIEETLDHLNDYVHPGGVVGGRLFKARGVGSTSPAKVPTTPVAYSLRASDFDVLDELKKSFAARSRSQLITAALTAHFQLETEKD